MTTKQRYLNIWCIHNVDNYLIPFSEDDQLYEMIHIVTATGISVSLFSLN